MQVSAAHRAVLFTRVDTEFPSFPSQSEGIMYVNCHIEALPCNELERKAIDVVAVLDRSGSMGGEKLQLVKSTMEFLMRELTNKDRLGVVTYDHEVTTNFPLTKMDTAGKSHLSSILERITAGGNTNLSGGLMQGLKEVQSLGRADGGDPNTVQSVLLMTDGLANVGVRDTLEVVNLVRSALNFTVSVFCFGYGSGHNAELLREVSTVGRGTYYFVEKIDGITAAFADCLGGLLSVVAQNIRVECTAMEGVEIGEIATKRPVVPLKPKVHIQIDLGDMYAEEHRDLLIAVTIPPLMAGAPSTQQELLHFKVSFVNILAGIFDEIETHAAIDRSDESTLDDRKPNSSVLYQMSRTMVATAMECAKKEADEGRFDEGAKILQAAGVSLEKDLPKLHGADTERAHSLMVDLKDLSSSMSTNTLYQRQGRYKMASVSQSHWMQRNCHTVDLAGVETAAEAERKSSLMLYSSGTKARLTARAKEFISESEHDM